MLRSLHGAAGALLASLFLAGCGSSPPANHGGPELAAGAGTQDADEIARRFGDYSKFVGHYWVVHDGEWTTWLKPTWVVPGASMALNQWACSESRCKSYSTDVIQYDPKDNVLKVLRNESGDGKTFRQIRTEHVQPDGSVGNSLGISRYDAATDTFRGSGLFWSSTSQKLTKAEFDADFARRRVGGGR